jgi:hypothetical protein
MGERQWEGREGREVGGGGNVNRSLDAMVMRMTVIVAEIVIRMKNNFFIILNIHKSFLPLFFFWNLYIVGGYVIIYVCG